MAEPENQTLRLLRDIREAIRALDQKTEGNINSLDAKIDRIHEDLKERIERVRQAAFGESVLGRYAAADWAVWSGESEP
jgi:hypothetical protein